MKFNVGDLALARNVNSLVVILDINQADRHPYLISRVDGAAMALDGLETEFRVSSSKQIWCSGSLLRNPNDLLLEDLQVYRLPDECQIAAFNAYEKAIQQLPPLSNKGP
jgi:hypothetical protein